MTTPKPVVLWTYAPLEERTDPEPSPAHATRYLPRELLPDPRHELHLEDEGVEFGPGDEVRYPPLAERLQRLASCSREGPSPHAERCLAHLAALDRAAAVEIARQWSQSELPEMAQPLVTALLQFPSPGSLESFLDGLGLTDQLSLDLADTEERPISLEELLLQRGRAHVFPLRPEEDSVRPDRLLRELASLAPGVLDGLLLEQLPPAESKLDGEGLETDDAEEEDFLEYAPAGRLVAHGAGKRYEAPARGEFALDQDDGFIDPGALLDFLNALARARGSDVRWVLFDTDGEACVVAAGPAPALEALQARGLIPATSPERIRAIEARYGGGSPPEL
ncbi:hypothetical protein JQX13_14820 [Archangium violaceum]|uniref:hypothetical protein n=1 Tax=Archangium violaceum TaxID=83451 RepID=UPI00193AFE61|nr:hypothetical protein [Archangium violaceum]QRK11229.1 hypothetical protein JQX13_14820 [Archangium violaceum]